MSIENGEDRLRANLDALGKEVYERQARLNPKKESVPNAKKSQPAGIGHTLAEAEMVNSQKTTEHKAPRRMSSKEFDAMIFDLKTRPPEDN